MKIGLLIYGSLDTLSGGYLYDRMLVDYLRAQGDELRIISLPWRNYATHLADNLSFRLPPGLDVLIQDELNHPSLISANLRNSGPGLGYPIVSLVHHLRCSESRPGWQNAFYRMIERRYLNSVDGFIFNSQTTRGVVTGLVGDRKPAILAYPPTDRFGDGPSEAFVRARAAEPGPLRLIFLGNVIRRKGLHTLLESLSTQRAQHLRVHHAVQPQVQVRDTMEEPPIILDVVGSLDADPAYARAMQDYASVHCPPTSVLFHGALDNAPLLEKLRRAHVLVVPSSYEGFGIVYLEGMACGLPAIGTTSGAAAEVIDDGQTGFLIRPEDASALAVRLQTLAADRGLLTRLSLHALARYRRQPTWEQTAGEIRGFLAKAVNG